MLTLYNSNGEQIVQDDDGGSGLSSYLTFASPTGGSYFAAVSSFDGGTGGYVLRVSDTDVPGHIYTDETLSAVAEGDDRIPQQAPRRAHLCAASAAGQGRGPDAGGMDGVEGLDDGMSGAGVVGAVLPESLGALVEESRRSQAARPAVASSRPMQSGSARRRVGWGVVVMVSNTEVGGWVSRRLRG